MNRRKATIDKYREYRKRNQEENITCPFCTDLDGQIVETYNDFLVVINIFAYDFWDNQGVTDHLMVIPKKHFKLVNDLSDDNKIELLQIIGEYELEGYNTYSRSERNAAGSIPEHMHWHLIELDEKLITKQKFQRKPYQLEVEQEA